jgi:hypothetical protein
MEIPTHLNAGDLWSWTDAQSDYPAPTWVLSYYFSGPKAFSITGTASGTNHAFAYAAASSKDYPHGDYRWMARAVNGSTETETVLARGMVSVRPNLANLAADHRSQWQQRLDVLEAVLSNRATTDQLSYSIAGRSVSRMSLTEIREFYTIARRQVAIELGRDPSRSLVSFA